MNWFLAFLVSWLLWGTLGGLAAALMLGDVPVGPVVAIIIIATIVPTKNWIQAKRS